MNLKKYLWNIPLLLTILCVACSDEKEPAIPTFSIDDSLLQQDVSQSEKLLIIRVETNLESSDWTATSTVPWCSVAKEITSYGGNLKIAIQANGEVDLREADIKIISTVQNYDIKIRQLGMGPAILVKESELKLAATGGTVVVTVTANVPYNVQRSENSEWLTEQPHTRAMTDKTYRYQAADNDSYGVRTAIFTYTYAEDPTVNATCTVTQKAKEGSLNDVEVEGDIQIKVQNGQDNGHQSGSGIDKTYDGDRSTSTHYHSPWNSPNTYPFVLEYFFAGTEDMDYIVYYPRNGNGNFGKFDLYIATQDKPEYVKYGSYDFGMKGTVSQLFFKERMPKVTKVKFEVNSGATGFASCSEMEFYKKNDHPAINDKLLTVFKDITCTELKEGVTDAAIDALPGYFAQIGFALKSNTYDPWEKKFRVHDYQAYSIPEEWATKLLTKKYSNLDNPTGIYVNAGDSVVALVGDTHGQHIYLQCIGEEKTGDPTYLQTAAGGETVVLSEGVNKLGFAKPGMLFVMYNTDISSPNANPIKIHIPLGSGYVSGYFDLLTDKTNDVYKELIEKASYKYFCVRGQRIMFYFHRTYMQNAVPYDMLSAINLWDQIISWEQELMGIENVYPSQFNNHVFAISPEGVGQTFMWASDYRIAFVYNTLPDILLKENVMAAKDNVWGPAHEIGHIHQGAINWATCTESSNNLFSNFVRYKLGKYGSRGVEMSKIAKSRYEYDEVWANMGYASNVGINEIHMRMYWQLWNEYHRLGLKPDFWQQLFKALRQDPFSYGNPGAAQLKFAVTASRIADENLTDFFDFWGFLTPIDIQVDDYGASNYKVTQSMIMNAKSAMAQYPKPKHAFYYLEDRKQSDFDIENYKVGDVGHYTTFKDNVKITKEVTCTRSGRTIRIKNGDEAVAFEVRKDNNRLYFSNFFTFDVPDNIPLEGAEIYAVQADGTHIRVKE
ncbi:MAG: M60 family metallopeptidase [Mediterranea sp.]|jgi:hypothetical protein|nr:M60 family metallopeptidase [Mediterranea sp.]